MGNSAAGEISERDIGASCVSDASVLHLNGSSLAMNQSMRGACYKTTELAYENDLIVSLDPNLRKGLETEECIRETLAPVVDVANILTPTKEEIHLIT